MPNMPYMPLADIFEQKQKPARTTIKFNHNQKEFVSKASPHIFSRYRPEDRPLPLSQHTENNNAMKQKSQPMAFCPACNCDRPIRWKPRERRSKNVESWFVCAICGCDRLEIRNMPGNSAHHLMSRK